MRLDVGKSLKFPFDDPGWIMKVVLGCLMQFLSLLIVPALAFSGYLVRTIRDTANGNDETLPEWDDWGSTIMSGLMVSLGVFIWMLVPLALITVGGGSIIVSLIMAIASGDSGAAPAIGLAGGAMSMILMAVGGVLLFVVTLFIPALSMRYAVTGDFGVFFQVGQAMSDILASPLDYLAIVAVPIGLSMAFATVVGLSGGLLGILALPFGVVAGLITAHLQGSYYRNCLQ